MALSDEEIDRYARHLVLRGVGAPGQAKLRAAKVALVGVGGLGAPAALYLAAAGVGTLGLIDDDRVSLSNLQRQILFAAQDEGRPKTDAAAEHLRALNPGTTAVLHQERLGPETAQRLLAPYDLVLDGSDSFETRAAVNAACFALGKTLISAAVGRFEGQLAVFKPGGSAPDGTPSPCYACLYPAAPQREAPCAEAGILGSVTGVLGTLQATQALKEITGLADGHESLVGKLLLVDLLAMRFRTLSLPRDPACPVCGGVKAR